MVNAYLSHLSKKFMRRVAGFTTEEGGYFLPRAQAEPPTELLGKIWPWIEGWKERFRMRSLRKTWDQGGLDEDDIAGQGFLALLCHLRVVLLQDLAVLQPDYPDLPFFQHEVFRMPSWPPYAEIIRASVHNPEYSRSLLLEQVLPEVSHAVYNSRDSLYHQVQRMQATLDAQSSGIKGLERQVSGLVISFRNFTNGGTLMVQLGQPHTTSSPPTVAATNQRGAAGTSTLESSAGVTAALTITPAMERPGSEGGGGGGGEGQVGDSAGQAASRPPPFHPLALHTIGDL